jgi:hypothetical protein
MVQMEEGPQTQLGSNAAEAARGLAVLTLAVGEFDRVEAGLIELRRKYKDVVFDVQTAEGMAAAKAARLDCRTPRYAVANALKSFKTEVNLTKRIQEDRAEKITGEIVEVESPIDAQIKSEESRAAAEKAAKAAAAEQEAARVRGALDALRNAPAHAAGKTAAEIDSIRLSVASVTVDLETFGDCAGEAMQAKSMSMLALDSMYDGALAMETMAAQLAEQQAREAAEKRAAEEKRVADERAERERVEAANKKAAADLAQQREEFAKEQALARAKAEAEEQRLRAERDALEAAERAARDYKERVERAERQRAEEAERQAREAQEQIERERRAAVEAQRAAVDAAEQRGRDQWRTLMQVCINAVQLCYAATTDHERPDLRLLPAAEVAGFVRGARQAVAAAGGSVV